MITVNSTPDLLAAARNPMVFKATTDNLETDPGSQAYFEFDFTAGTPAIGDTIGFTYLTLPFLITFIDENNAPLINEVQANNVTGASIADWIDSIFLEQVKKNPYILMNFTLSRSGSVVRFTHNEVGAQASFAQSVSGGIVTGTVDLGTDRTTRDIRIVADLYLEDTYQSDVFEHKLRIPSPPESNGQSDFQIDDILRSYLNWDFPLFGEATFTICPNILRRYYIFWSELFDNIYNPAVAPLTALDIRTCAFAGVDYKRFQTLDFASTFKNGTVKFLTNMPRTRKISKEQPLWLYFYLRSAIDLSIAGTIYYSDGTSTNYNTWGGSGPMFTADNIYRVDLGYDSLAIGSYNVLKTVIKYTAAIYNVTDSVNYSETLTFKVDQIERAYNRYFIFGNSLGGVDTIWCHGLKKEQMGFSSEEFRTKEPIEWANDVIPPLTGFIGRKPKVGLREFEVNTGAKSLDEYLWICEELLYSTSIFEIGSDRFIEVIDKVESVAMAEDDKNVNSLTFKGAYAHTNINATTAV